MTKPMAIAIMIAIAAAAMYIPVGGCAISGTGDGAAATGSTTKLVSWAEE